MKEESMDIAGMIAENLRRNAALRVDYDPVSGLGACGRRVEVTVPWEQDKVWLPESMPADPAYALLADQVGYRKLRHKHDFEYWCATCVRIRHKLTGRRVPFVLNAPQRRLTAQLEERRLAGVPLRLIMLKARQWGGSTLVQMYFAWIQILHRTNWHSLVCAHVQSTAAVIRRMYARMLDDYPPELWPEDTPPKFMAVAGASNSREIAGRGCCVTVASSYSQEAARGLDCSMVHLSEVAFWKDSDTMAPADFIRAVSS